MQYDTFNSQNKRFFFFTYCQITINRFILEMVDFHGVHDLKQHPCIMMKQLLSKTTTNL